MRWPWQRKREKRPPRVGLALSGGSVRGAAHIGVLEVLEAAGIRPDCVAGTSAGSVVGAVYCAGMPLSEIKRLARQLQWSKLVRLTRPRLGFLDTQRLEDYLNEVLDGRTFEELEIPFAAVAVDILRGEVVVLREGPVAPAVRASCSLPGVAVPVQWDDRLLVDGGVLNNLPVSPVREMGAEYVIAVDLHPRGVQAHSPPKTLMEMWSLTFYTLVGATHSEAEDADCLIVPDIYGFSWVDFSQVDTLIEKGREAALACLPKLRQDLGLG